MIISASRRTDIPSYYSEWFYNRIQEGYVLVRNPMNIHQISKINLSPDIVDGIVFWTKNPAPMLKRLNELERYSYYFQFTLTPYGEEIEPNLPSKRNVVISQFIELSDKIGPDRVIWRYDPIILNHQYTVQNHIRYFEMLAKILKGFTKRCVISFVDMYRNTRNNVKSLGLEAITNEDMIIIAEAFSEIAKKYDLKLCTCSESIELSQYDISHAHCIDKDLFECLMECKLQLAKDPNQREECGCVASIDIGAYNSCKSMCKYCYANYNTDIVDKNYNLHNPKSPLLFGEIGKEDKITERKMVSLKDEQMSLF
ncbi:MAG: DUF1848 domain-containing protein [Lacrimispora sp.]|uniref:DUF1848 domain-containing protein n=1 Tax=Lacrimispora sp. TaxID=2719234 RepID=UPI0039E48E97